MKNKLNIVAVTFISLVLIPQIALASWWNPFSWFSGWTFHKTEITIENPTQKNTVPTTVTNDVSDKVVTPTTDTKQKNSPAVVKIVSKKDTTQSQVPKTISQVVIPTPVDVCTNIEGIQTFIPAGMIATSNICTAIQTIPSPTDVCLNIEGIQTVVPGGMTATGNICTIIPTLTPEKENIITNSVLFSGGVKPRSEESISGPFQSPIVIFQITSKSDNEIQTSTLKFSEEINSKIQTFFICDEKIIFKGLTANCTVYGNGFGTVITDSVGTEGEFKFSNPSVEDIAGNVYTSDIVIIGKFLYYYGNYGGSFRITGQPVINTACKGCASA